MLQPPLLHDTAVIAQLHPEAGGALHPEAQDRGRLSASLRLSAWLNPTYPTSSQFGTRA
jgi:hypothetical protein